jgi:hypothetical protein
MQRPWGIAGTSCAATPHTCTAQAVHASPLWTGRAVHPRLLQWLRQLRQQALLHLEGPGARKVLGLVSVDT